MSLHSRSITSNGIVEKSEDEVSEELDRILEMIGELFPGEVDTPYKERDMAIRIALAYLECNGLDPEMLSIVATPNEEQ